MTATDDSTKPASQGETPEIVWPVKLGGFMGERCVVDSGNRHLPEGEIVEVMNRLSAAQAELVALRRPIEEPGLRAALSECERLRQSIVRDDSFDPGILSRMKYMLERRIAHGAVSPLLEAESKDAALVRKDK